MEVIPEPISFTTSLSFVIPTKTPLRGLRALAVGFLRLLRLFAAICSLPFVTVCEIFFRPMSKSPGSIRRSLETTPGSPTNNPIPKEQK